MKALLLVLLCASNAAAQSVPLDRLTPPLPLAQRHAAEILSNVTLYTTVGLDTWASWQADDWRAAFLKQGLRVGLTEGIVYVTKRVARRTRPCAPACGVDEPDRSFPSGHTALAFASIGRRHVAITMPLAFSTGAMRIAAGKHFLTDVLAGAGIGAVSGLIH